MSSCSSPPMPACLACLIFLWKELSRSSSPFTLSPPVSVFEMMLTLAYLCSPFSCNTGFPGSIVAVWAISSRRRSMSARHQTSWPTSLALRIDLDSKKPGLGGRGGGGGGAGTDIRTVVLVEFRERESHQPFSANYSPTSPLAPATVPPVL